MTDNLKVVKLGQIFELEGKQFILAHVDCRKYNLVGITRGFYSPNPVEFDDYYKKTFTKEDMKKLAIMRFNDLMMLPQNIKLCDFFSELTFSELKLGQKFQFTDLDTEKNKNIFQKIDNNWGHNVLNLKTYYSGKVEDDRRVKLVQD